MNEFLLYIIFFFIFLGFYFLITFLCDNKNTKKYRIECKSKINNRFLRLDIEKRRIGKKYSYSHSSDGINYYKFYDEKYVIFLYLKECSTSIINHGYILNDNRWFNIQKDIGVLYFYDYVDGKKYRYKVDNTLSMDQNIVKESYLTYFEVKTTDDFSTIKRKYINLAKIYHPDMSTGSEEKMTILNLMYNEAKEKHQK